MLPPAQGPVSLRQERGYYVQDDQSYRQDVEMAESPHVRPLYTQPAASENDWEVQQVSYFLAVILRPCQNYDVNSSNKEGDLFIP